MEDKCALQVELELKIGASSRGSGMQAMGEGWMQKNNSSTWPGEVCTGKDICIMQEDSFMGVKGFYINPWVLRSPPLQELVDLGGVI